MRLIGEMYTVYTEDGKKSVKRVVAPMNGKSCVQYKGSLYLVRKIGLEYLDEDNGNPRPIFKMIGEAVITSSLTT